MPRTLTATAAAHGELDCLDTEALLLESTAEIDRLRTENQMLRHQVDDLLRRLDDVSARKRAAIDEAISLRVTQ